MSLTPRHRHLISDFEDRKPASIWPWIIGWLLVFGLAVACGFILGGSMVDEEAWRPLWGGIVGVVALVIVAAMALALVEERRDERSFAKQLIQALRGAHGLPVDGDRGRRRAG